MKYCKFCKTEIPANAKICPNCKKKQSGYGCLIVLLVFVAIGVIVGISTSNKQKEFDDIIKNPQSVEYIKVSKDALDKELKDNAAAAKDKYNGKYVEITGKLGTIDSDLKYISLVSSTNSFDLNGVHCTMKNDDQKNKVKTLKADQSLTIRGKVTEVGEVLGFFVDIIEIVG